MYGKLLLAPLALTAIDMIAFTTKATYNTFFQSNTASFSENLGTAIVDINIPLVVVPSYAAGMLTKAGFVAAYQGFNSDVSIPVAKVIKTFYSFFQETANSNSTALTDNNPAAVLIPVKDTLQSNDLFDMAYSKFVNDILPNSNSFLQNNAISLAAAGSLGALGAYYSKEAYYTITNKSADFQAKIIPTAIALTSFVASAYLLSTASFE